MRPFSICPPVGSHIPFSGRLCMPARSVCFRTLDFRLVIQVLLSPRMFLNACVRRLHPCLKGYNRAAKEKWNRLQRNQDLCYVCRAWPVPCVRYFLIWSSRLQSLHGLHEIYVTAPAHNTLPEPIVCSICVSQQWLLELSRCCFKNRQTSIKLYK